MRQKTIKNQSKIRRIIAICKHLENNSDFFAERKRGESFWTIFFKSHRFRSPLVRQAIAELYFNPKTEEIVLAELYFNPKTEEIVLSFRRQGIFYSEDEKARLTKAFCEVPLIMPKKIRELKSLLLKTGFSYDKGSQTKWKHPRLSKIIIISGKDGSDARDYLEKQVNDTLKQLKEMEGATMTDDKWGQASVSDICLCRGILKQACPHLSKESLGESE